MQVSKMPLNTRASCRAQLGYPIHPSEFEVQAYLYDRLMSLGYDVRGEVKGHAKSRFDLVIYHRYHVSTSWRKMPVRIIEVKRVARSMREGTRCHQQVNGYYERYGVPVDAVCGMKEARRYVEVIQTIMPPPRAMVI